MNQQSIARWRPALLVGLCLLLAPGCTRAHKARRLLAAGEHDFAGKHYDAAEIELTSVLRLTPVSRTGVAQKYLGLMYFDEGRIPYAYAYLNNAHRLLPGDMEITLALARVLDAAGLGQRAAPFAAAALAALPGNPDAPVALVDSARTPEALASARDTLQALEITSPSNPGVPTALGMLALRQTNTAEAETDFQHALQLDTNCSEAHLGLAGIYALRRQGHGTEEQLRLAAQSAPPRSVARLRYAEFESRVGAVSSALDILQQVLREAPDFMPASLALMRLQFNQHDYSGAAATVAKILARDPRNAEALMEAGSIALVRRDPAKALQVFQDMDHLTPNRPAIKYQLAIASLMGGDKTAAMAALNQAVKLDPNFSRAAVLLANLHIRTGETADAMAVLEPLIKKNPNDIDAQLELARAYLAERRPSEALAVYDQMLKRFPNSPQIPFLIGGVYEMEQRLPEAFAAYQRALSLAPRNLPTVEKLIDLALRGKNYTEAKKIIAQQMQQNPSLPEPWLLQGRVQWAMGQTNDAVASFSKAIDLNATSPAPYLLLAQLYLASHQEDQALARLSMLTAKTNNTTALIEIGGIHQLLHQYDAARDAYQKAYESDPKSAIALNNMAYLDSEYLNNLPKARELAEQARQLTPNDPRSADTLGWVLYKEGDYPRALTLLQEAAEAMSADPEVQAHLGMTYYMMGERAMARLYLDRALAGGGDFSGKTRVEEARALLVISRASAGPHDRELIEHRLAESPGDPIALADLANVEEREGHFDRAADAYEKILKDSPKDWNAMIQLARLYSGPLDNVRKALDYARSAHDIAPQQGVTSAMLGELIYRSGDGAAALNLLREAADQAPTNAPVLYDLAWAEYTTGHIHQADSAMEKAVRYGDSLTNLDDARQFVALRAAASDFSQALPMSNQVRQILQRQPDYLPAEMILGSLEEHSGEDDAARALYYKILDQYPSFAPAMRQLALMAANQPGEDSKAYELGQKAQATLMDDGALTRALGILAYRHADYGRSAELLRESEDDGPALYYLGMDYYHLQRPADSKRALNRALALKVPDSLAVEAHRVLAELK